MQIKYILTDVGCTEKQIRIAHNQLCDLFGVSKCDFKEDELVEYMGGIFVFKKYNSDKHKILLQMEDSHTKIWVNADDVC